MEIIIIGRGMMHGASVYIKTNCYFKGDLLKKIELTGIGSDVSIGDEYLVVGKVISGPVENALTIWPKKITNLRQLERDHLP